MRALFSLMLALTTLFTTSLASASSYLDTAALLLDESRRSMAWVERRLQDKELAKAAHLLAETRIQAGRRLEVPKKMGLAHPHLLLTLEISERALHAAKSGDSRRFLRLRRQAREEERAYRELLQQAKKSLPEIERQRPSR